MARSRTFVAAPPQQVFDVLADADRYADWVVGTHSVRAADAEFPAPGSRFHHRIGVGPLTVSDHTEVLDVNPPYRLDLRARARPFGTARVTLLLEPREDGTVVTMLEDAADPLSRIVFNPVAQLLVRGRNDESLRRLRDLVERRSGG